MAKRKSKKLDALAEHREGKKETFEHEFKTLGRELFTIGELLKALFNKKSSLTEQERKALALRLNFAKQRFERFNGVLADRTMFSESEATDMRHVLGNKVQFAISYPGFIYRDLGHAEFLDVIDGVPGHNHPRKKSS